jgi:hypothetical protein
MRVRRVLGAALAAVMVAACATSATNTLSQAKRDALRLDEIELSFAPDAMIFWLDALNEFKNSGAPDTPEARRAFLQQKAVPHIKAALDAEVRPAFRGTDPARLRVIVRRIDVPPAVLRILVGNPGYALKADIRVVDGKTGQALVEAPDFNGIVSTQGGLIGTAVEQLFPDPIDRVSRAFATALRAWLQTGQALASGDPSVKFR